MGRLSIVTGAASGIGAACAVRLRARGDEVVAVDVAGGDVVADLCTAEGRGAVVAAVGDRVVDVVVANAGTIGRRSGDVRLNYFGAVDVLEGLRPRLAASSSARATVTASFALVQAVDDDLVSACLAGDEERAAALADRLDALTVYASTKRALARWARRQAVSPAWAGAGIGLNAVAPGIVRTAMTAPLLDEPSTAELLTASVPMPYGGVADADAVARVLDFLTAAETVGVTGQVVFVDGGAECVTRGDDVWP